MKCSSSTLSCYGASCKTVSNQKQHGIHACMLPLCLILAWTYRFALSCLMLFQLFLDFLGQALFSASLYPHYKCCFKTLCYEYMCQGAGFTFLLLRSVSPLLFSLSPWAVFSANRCGERFCWLSHWNASTLPCTQPITQTQLHLKFSFSFLSRYITKEKDEQNSM